jgi:hypothetical protein
VAFTKSSRRFALALLVASAGPAATEAASAEDAEPTVSYELDYRAPASCPGEDAFTKRIARRTSRARRSSTGQGKYRFTVEFLLSDTGARGTLRIAEKDGASTERDVPARDCASAVEAMALIAAVILDPRAATVARADEAKEATAAVETAPPAAGADAAANGPAPEPNSAQQPAPPPAGVPDSNPTERASDESVSWRMRLRAAGALQGAVAPGGALGANAGAEVYRDGPGLFEPRFALTMHVAFGDSSTSFGDAAFSWYAGRLTACPIQWPESGRLRLRGCAFAEAGALHGEGSNTRNPRGSTAFWLAAGPSAEVELEVTRWLAVAVEGGMTVPAFHDKFIFVPQQVAHEVPTMGGWLAAGLRIGPP